MTSVRAIALAVVCASIPGCEPTDTRVDADLPVDTDAGSGADDNPIPPAAGREDTGPPPNPDGDVFLRNRVALDMDILIRPLHAEAALDCDEVAADPGALELDAFSEGITRTLHPHEITAVWPHAPGERECYAVWIESEGLGARILFWWDGDPPPRVAPIDCCSEGPGIVQLIPTDDGWSLHLIGDTRLVHTPRELE